MLRTTVQIGSADALFERPQHTFVGHFIGSPGMNFLAARATGDAVEIAGHTLALPGGRELPPGDFKLGVRPEYVSLAAAGAAGALPATVTRVQDIGTHTMLTALVGETPVKVRLHSEAALPQAGEGQVLGPHTCFYANEELVA